MILERGFLCFALTVSVVGVVFRLAEKLVEAVRQYKELLLSSSFTLE
jgi:hypothetical protein